MPTSNTQTKASPKEISWQTHSRTEPNRSPGWYIGFAIISLAGISFAIFYSQSVITTITFILIILVILILSNQTSHEITYRLNAHGINAGRTLYPYKTIKRFWLDYRPPEVKTLNFETTAYLNHKIAVQLGDQDPMAVKIFLSQYLREDLNHEESPTEALARRLKI